MTALRFISVGDMLSRPLPPDRLMPLYQTLEVFADRKASPKKLWQARYKGLVYGFWTVKGGTYPDGTIVVFNRAYRPLYRQEPSDAWKPFEHREWVKGVGAATKHFYYDGTPETLRPIQALKGMIELGLLMTWEAEAALAACERRVRSGGYCVRLRDRVLKP